jgi:hypothetical protein
MLYTVFRRAKKICLEELEDLYSATYGLDKESWSRNTKCFGLFFEIYGVLVCSLKYLYFTCYRDIVSLFCELTQQTSTQCDPQT